MNGRYAVVSIGTNSTRALLADVAGDVPRVTLQRSIGTRIGEGLDDTGNIGDEPMGRTLAAVSQLQRAIAGRYVKLFAIATSAVRRAHNAGAFLARVEALLGVPVRVLSGEEEANASFRGAVTTLAPMGVDRVGVVDVGGGSTEYATGTNARAEFSVSCEIGAVRLTEAVPALNGRGGAVSPEAVAQARAIVAEALEPLRRCDAVDRVVLVGGTATTTAAIIGAPGRTIARQRVTRAQLAELLGRLCESGLEERKRIGGMRAQRADILPAGIIAIDTAMAFVQADAALVSASDLLLGVLLDAYDTQGRAGSRRLQGARPIPSRGFRP